LQLQQRRVKDEELDENVFHRRGWCGFDGG